MLTLHDKATKEESKLAKVEHAEFYAFKLLNLQGLKLPEVHMSEPNRVQRFQYAVVARVTLLSLKNGFFGRTYQSSRIALDPTTLAPAGGQVNDYVMMYTKYKDSDIHAVVEFVINIREQEINSSAIQNSQEEIKSSNDLALPVNNLSKRASVGPGATSQKNLGIGFVIVPLFAEGN